MRHINAVRRAVPLLVPVLLVPACSSSSPERPAAAKSTTSAPKSPAPSPSLTAANGTDVKACKKGDCEIVVRGKTADIPLAETFGIHKLYVTHVPPNKMNYVVLRTNGQLTRAYHRGTGMFSLAYGPKITVTRLDETGAVLRFEPKKGDKKNDRISGSLGAGFLSEG